MSAFGGEAPVILVAAVGAAEGARGAAAALACAGADAVRAGLRVDLGGRAPGPPVPASAAAQRLEERLVVHLPAARVAARGQTCHLAVAADPEGLAVAAAAATVAREGAVVLHAPPPLFRSVLDDGPGPVVTGVLLRADLGADRALLALLVRDLLDRDLAVAVAKRRLGWVAERRALFGAPESTTAGSQPPPTIRRLLSHRCYIDSDEPKPDPARAAKPERRDHAGTGPR